METLHPGNRKAAIGVGLATLLFMLLLNGLAFFTGGQNPLLFAHIGTRFALHDPQGTVGYDGQFAYFIARDGAAAVPFIDGPSLRYQRIIYPLLSRALALGRAELVPWTLLLVNIIAQSVGAGLLAYLISMLGGSPYAGLVYGLWIGGVFSVRLDLNEPLCFALGLAGVLLYLQQRYRWAILALMLATLTKELGMIFAVGIALHLISQRKWRWASLFVAGPLLLFLSWWGIMRLWFGSFPTRYPAGKIHLLPLQGMFTEESPIELFFLILWLGIPAVILFVAALLSIWRRRQILLGAALVIMGAGFVLVMPDVSWQDPAAAYRVGTPLLITGLLFVGQVNPQRWKSLAALWISSLLLMILVPQLWLGGS